MPGGRALEELCTRTVDNLVDIAVSWAGSEALTRLRGDCLCKQTGVPERLARVPLRRTSLRSYRNLYDLRMKTTLDIDDQLLSEAKALAARQRTSLTRLIEEGLHLRLRTLSASRRSAKVALPLLKGRGGLVAGIDPLSNKALLDALGDDA